MDPLTVGLGLKAAERLLPALREAFPHGHPDFLPLLLDKMKLHSNKNHDYAKGGAPLGNFTRVAAILGQYPGLSLSDPVVVMLVYALKQLDALLWGLAQGIEHRVEGPVERLGDILVYSGIASCALQDRARQSKATSGGPHHGALSATQHTDVLRAGEGADPDVPAPPVR